MSRNVQFRNTHFGTAKIQKYINRNTDFYFKVGIVYVNAFQHV